MTTIDREADETATAEQRAEERVAAIMAVAYQRFVVASRKAAGARDRRGLR